MISRAHSARQAEGRSTKELRDSVLPPDFAEVSKWRPAARKPTWLFKTLSYLPGEKVNLGESSGSSTCPLARTNNGGGLQRWISCNTSEERAE